MVLLTEEDRMAITAFLKAARSAFELEKDNDKKLYTKLSRAVDLLVEDLNMGKVISVDYYGTETPYGVIYGSNSKTEVKDSWVKEDLVGVNDGELNEAIRLLNKFTEIENKSVRRIKEYRYANKVFNTIKAFGFNYKEETYKHWHTGGYAISVNYPDWYIAKKKNSGRK